MRNKEVSDFFSDVTEETTSLRLRYIFLQCMHALAASCLAFLLTSWILQIQLVFAPINTHVHDGTYCHDIVKVSNDSQWEDKMHNSLVQW